MIPFPSCPIPTTASTFKPEHSTHNYYTMSTSLMEPQGEGEARLMDHAEIEDDTQQPLTIEKKGSFAEMVVKAAAGLNRLVLQNCSICTLYCDKQVQYETTVMERYVTGTSTLWNSPEMEDFKSQLFDEQSVVESVHSRCED
jgi:hypothetical protein